MRTRFLEKYNFIVLLIVVITSFVQMGILWNYQNHGFPFNFFEQTFEENKQINIDSSKFIKPMRITMTSGLEEIHYVIKSTDPFYDKLWSESKSYLKDIFIDQKPIIKRKYNDDELGELSVKRSIIIEMPNVIDNELIADAINLDNPAPQPFNGIIQIILLPQEQINNEIQIVITDSQNFYYYKIRAHQLGMSNKDWEETLKYFDTNKIISKYNVLKEIFPNKSKRPFEFRPNIPILLGSNKVLSIKDIEVKVPVLIQEINKESNLYKSRLAKSLLGREKDSFDIGFDNNENIAFKNFNNIYRLYRDGYLEYKYLMNTQEEAKGSMIRAFEQAISFIETKNISLSKNEIIFTGIQNKENAGYYTFEFEYLINGYKVISDNYDVSNKKIKTSIEIKANEKRVLNTNWLIKDLEIIPEENKKYNADFEQIITELFKKYPNISKANLSLIDIFAAYKLEKQNYNTQVSKPEIIFLNKNGEKFSVVLKVNQ